MKSKKIEFGKFCELYGKSIRNRVLEFLLEMRNLDFAVGDLAEEIGISKPKAYEEIKKLEKEGYVVKTRIVAGTQLYIINKENVEVRLLMKNFQECLDLVVEEYAPEEKVVVTTSRIGMPVTTKPSL